MIVQCHMRLPVCIFSVKIAALGFLKRVTGRAFKISMKFQRSKLKLSISSTKKIAFIIISLQKMFVLFHNPFNNVRPKRVEEESGKDH